VRWRPTALLAWLLWVLVVAFGESVVIPYQIDWFALTHPFVYGAEGFVDALGGPILVFAMRPLRPWGPWLPHCAQRMGLAGYAWHLASSSSWQLWKLGSVHTGVPSLVLEPISSSAWILTIPPLPITLMLVIFPGGRLTSRRWYAVVALALAGYALTFLGEYVPGDEAHTGWPIGVWISLAALLASVAAVVLRWRRSTDQERHQLKWLVYMVVLAVVAGLTGLALGA
jgi:hypothetical protein